MSVVYGVAIAWTLKLLYGIWWKPKAIEKKLRKQGIHGYPYKLIYGNTTEMMELAKEKGSEPVEQPHDIVPRINPLLHDLATTHSMSCRLLISVDFIFYVDNYFEKKKPYRSLQSKPEKPRNLPWL